MILSKGRCQTTEPKAARETIFPLIQTRIFFAEILQIAVEFILQTNHLIIFSNSE
jgi:hypothetical protein